MVQRESHKMSIQEVETHETLRDIRVGKLNTIIESGINPYPTRFMTNGYISEIKEDWKFLCDEDDTFINAGISAAGRITSIRGHGNSTFMDIADSSGSIQLFISKKVVGENAYKLVKNLDIGDFIGACGDVKKTQAGEITIFVGDLILLSKSLIPSVEKWTGLKNEEVRYKQRYLDLVCNEETRNIFKMRSAFVRNLRNYIDLELDGMEVETPILCNMASGASAKPFETYHNTKDKNLHLRIAPELYLKRLLVGGFERVYEIGRCFRNEGMDTKHNPEFTSLELYCAYMDYDELMTTTEDMLISVFCTCLGISPAETNYKFEYNDEIIYFNSNWTKIKYFDILKSETGVDFYPIKDIEQLTEIANSLNVTVDKTMGIGKILDKIFSAKVKETLIDPTFIYDYPIELSPLAKCKHGSTDIVERFQLYIGGLEVGNAFTELNDPIEQRKRFEEQLKLKDLGDEEAQEIDEDFITALEVGMPPAAGLGLGIDRLVMLLTNTQSIKEVILFPHV